VATRQAIFKALGLPWYGGRLPKLPKVLDKMTSAIVAAEVALEMLPAVAADKPDSAKDAGELLNEGARAGIILQRDTVRTVQAELDAARRGERECDLKLLRLGNDAGNALAKLAVRVAEGAFRAQEGNALLQLLEQLKAQQAEKTVVDQPPKK
jgi:hypothetical protein